MESAEALGIVERLRETRKLFLYRPYPVQYAFHAEGRTHRDRLLMKGNRVGGTQCGAMEIAMHATGLYPDWWPGRVYRRPLTIWTGAESAQNSRDGIQKTLLGTEQTNIRHPMVGTGAIPREDIVAIETKQAGIKNVAERIIVRHYTDGRYDGDTTIALKQYEQGRLALQGPQVDVCIAAGELVQMADGALRPIEEVRPGESVVGLNGAGVPVVRRVIALHAKGPHNCIRVRPKHGTDIVLTPDHGVFWGYQKSSKSPASEVKAVAQPIPGSFWPAVTEDRDDAWYAWAGLAVSEGYFAARKITNGNVAMMNRAIAMLPSVARVRRKDFDNGHVSDWFLVWMDFWSEISPGLSHEKRIPDWVFRSSPAKAALFLRWLYAGDGWANGHTVGYATTSRALAQQIAVLLNRLGVRASLSVRKSAEQNWRDQFWVSIYRSNDVQTFIERIGIEGKDDACSRILTEAKRRIAGKKCRAAHMIRSGNPYFIEKDRRAKLKASPVTTVEDAGIHDVYDLSVEGEHRFFCGTSLVSNCWPDEEPKHDPMVYSEFLARTQAVSDGMLFMTFSPLNGRTQVVSEFMDNPNKSLTRMTIWDAAGGIWPEGTPWAGQEWKGHIDHERVQEIIDAYPEHEREARAMGEPMAGEGKVFTVPESQIRVEPFVVPDHFRQIGAMDFGIDHPFAAVKLALDPDDDCVYVTHEYRIRGAVPAVHIAALRPWGEWLPWAWPHDGENKEKGSGQNLWRLYAGPHGLRMLGRSARYQEETGGGQKSEPIVLDLTERMMTGRFRVFSTCQNWFQEYRNLHRKNGVIVPVGDDLMKATFYGMMDLRKAMPERLANMTNKVVPLRPLLKMWG